jgi:23S rRNA (adenine2503-C2)-methyltransferase
MTRAELAQAVSLLGERPVHVRKIWRSLYVDGVTDFAQMETIPTALRTKLSETFEIAGSTVAQEMHSSDGLTRKYALKLADGRLIETVLMRYKGRTTVCLSSQAGCAMGCVFCATGQGGFGRNLEAGEIVAQAMLVNQVLRETSMTGTARLAETSSPSAHRRHERLRNVVLMGMGEPLQNYDTVMRAMDILRDEAGLALAAQRISVSTVGVIPGIIRLADEARPIQLAVSLHAATQEERAALVPVAKKWPLADLMEACRYYTQKLERRIFFEWALIKGANDTPTQARAVGNLLRGIEAQVNLIPLNPTTGYSGAPTDDTAARAFQAVLMDEFKIPVTIRERRGVDIGAGCGQLAGAKK